MEARQQQLLTDTRKMVANLNWTKCRTSLGIKKPGAERKQWNCLNLQTTCHL